MLADLHFWPNGHIVKMYVGMLAVLIKIID